MQNHQCSVTLLREWNRYLEGWRVSKDMVWKVRMDMEWIYFVSVRERKKQGVSRVLVQQDSHLKVSQLEVKNVRKTGMGMGAVKERKPSSFVKTKGHECRLSLSRQAKVVHLKAQISPVICPSWHNYSLSTSPNPLSWYAVSLHVSHFLAPLDSAHNWLI